MKANDPKALCDVCDEVTQARAKVIVQGGPRHKEKVDAKRIKFGKKPIDYAAVSSHSMPLGETESGETVESRALLEAYVQMNLTTVYHFPFYNTSFEL
jgi:hypothetical protein